MIIFAEKDTDSWWCRGEAGDALEGGFPAGGFDFVDFVAAQVAIEKLASLARTDFFFFKERNTELERPPFCCQKMHVLLRVHRLEMQ